MVRHLPELLRAGVTSLKIEGRAEVGILCSGDHKRLSLGFG